MADPTMYIQATCTECGTLIVKPHETPAKTPTASSYHAATEMPKAPRHNAHHKSAVCSRCRGKTKISAKDRSP